MKNGAILNARSVAGMVLMGMLALVSCGSAGPMLSFQESCGGPPSTARAGQRHLDEQIEIVEVIRWEDLALILCRNRTGKPLRVGYKPRYLHKSGAELRAGAPPAGTVTLPGNGSVGIEVPIPDPIRDLTQGVGISFVDRAGE